MREVACALPAAADLDRTGFRTAHIRHTARRKVHVIRRHADRARLAVKARGTHDALLIDRRARQRVTRRCGHENEAPVGFDETFVRNRLLHRGLCRDDRDFTVAVEVERHGFARREYRCALTRNNNPLVHDILAEQGDRSLIFCNKRGAVDDFPIRRCADKGILPRHKVRIRNVHRRGDDRPRIHLCSGRKEDARRVDEKDTTVCRERTEDLGGIPPEHTVQEGCLCIRLIDIDALTRANVERVPVDDGVLRCLMNRHLRLRCGNVCRARCHRSPLRQCHHVMHAAHYQCTCRQDADPAAQTAAHPSTPLLSHHAHIDIPLQSKHRSDSPIKSEEFINLKPESPIAIRIRNSVL